MGNRKLSTFKTLVSLLIIFGFGGVGFAESKKPTVDRDEEEAKRRCGVEWSKLAASARIKPSAADKSNHMKDCVPLEKQKIQQASGAPGQCKDGTDALNKAISTVNTACARAKLGSSSIEECIKKISECVQGKNNSSECKKVRDNIAQNTPQNEQQKQQAEQQQKQQDQAKQEADKKAEEIRKIDEQIAEQRVKTLEERKKALDERDENAMRLAKEKNETQESRQERLRQMQSEVNQIKTAQDEARKIQFDAHLDFYNRLVQMELDCIQRAQEVGNNLSAQESGLTGQNQNRRGSLQQLTVGLGQGGIQGRAAITSNASYVECMNRTVNAQVSPATNRPGPRRAPGPGQALMKQLHSALKQAEDQSKRALEVEARKMKLQREAIGDFKAFTVQTLNLIDAEANLNERKYAEKLNFIAQTDAMTMQALQQQKQQIMAGGSGASGVLGQLLGLMGQGGSALANSPIGQAVQALTGGAAGQDGINAAVYEVFGNIKDLHGIAATTMFGCGCSKECTEAKKASGQRYPTSTNYTCPRAGRIYKAFMASNPGTHDYCGGGTAAASAGEFKDPSTSSTSR